MSIVRNLEPGRKKSEHRRRSHVVFGLVAVLLVFFLTSCTWFKEETEPSAEQSYQLGMAKFDKKKYRDAIPYFQKILENYPFSIYAVPSELKIAECHFLNKKYTEALVFLEGFEELHPTNDQIPFVIWMKSVSYYEQFSSIDRDVSSLENARRELEELQLRFPTSSYTEDGDDLMGKVLWRLARHDFYVANFYYRDADYQAAMARLYGILEAYRGEDITAKTMYYIGKCHFFLQDNEEAKEVFEALIETYPKSKYVPNSKKFVKDIEKGRFTIVSKFFRFKERVFGYVGYE